MKKIVFALLLLTFLGSCKEKRNIPDVSDIKVDINLLRFEQDFFALDTNHLSAGIDRLQEKYGSFLNDFLYNILALPPMPDSVVARVKLFLHDYQPVNDSVQQKFKSFKEYEQQIISGLRFVKYYFPAYELPKNIISFVGPVEGYGNVLTSSGLAIGLQLYMGKDFSLYQTDYISEIYPEYHSRRFDPAYIAVNCMRNLVDDMYPLEGGQKPLIVQMIAQGKRMYLIDQLLPRTADSLKTGYTSNQLKGCYDHEAAIWNYFVQNNLVYEKDPALIRDYVSDGPKTTALGEASPGNIGLFVGWQIVKKWMAQNKDVTLPALMQTPEQQIFEQAKYKPR